MFFLTSTFQCSVHPASPAADIRHIKPFAFGAARPSPPWRRGGAGLDQTFLRKYNPPLGRGGPAAGRAPRGVRPAAAASPPRIHGGGAWRRPPRPPPGPLEICERGGAAQSDGRTATRTGGGDGALLLRVHRQTNESRGRDLGPRPGARHPDAPKGGLERGLASPPNGLTSSLSPISPRLLPAASGATGVGEPPSRCSCCGREIRLGVFKGLHCRRAEQRGPEGLQ